MFARFILQPLLFVILIVTATACYTMPGEDDFSLVPMTNHPDYTGGGNKGSAIPGLPATIGD